MSVLLALAAAAATVSAPACPPTTIFKPGLDHLEGYRFFTGADGDSAVEPIRIDAKLVPMLKTGKQLGLIALPKPGTRAPQIVVGAADVELAPHPSPYPEMFIMLGGSVTVRTAKFQAELKPGSVLLFEDMTATVGHGGHTGPCGYVSLSIAP